MLLLAHYNFGKIKIKKEGVEKEMFVRTATIIANQGEKIVTLTDEIKKANESNKVLRDEKEYLELENWHLKEFKNKVTSIVNSKDTIVNKFDKIKELSDITHKKSDKPIKK